MEIGEWKINTRQLNKKLSRRNGGKEMILGGGREMRRKPRKFGYGERRAQWWQKPREFERLPHLGCMI
jgi:hypothetical protein